MVPRVGKRGASFIEAGRYFLHDKGKETNERVAWTATHNIPTNDPEKALKWMAYTALNRERLKQEAGVVATGRKGHDKPVFHYSLAWGKDQEPKQDHMLEMAHETLELLGLSSHEAVFVAHGETEHPHVHVIVNLVHPENGKTLEPKYSKMKLSKWSEDYERNVDKQIRCEQRVINNEKRKSGERVKYQSERLERARLIQGLYDKAPTSIAFQKSLEEAGYSLATGDRRGYVLVDQEGEIYDLSRQLKGQRAKDIKARLSDLQELPRAQDLRDERHYFQRDQYETDFQKRIVDEAIEQDLLSKKERDEKSKAPKKSEYQSFADDLDQTRKKEEAANLAALKKAQTLRDYYQRNEYEKNINDLKIKLEKARKQSERTKLQQELDYLRQNLRNVDERMKEQGVTPDDPAKRDYSKDQSSPTPANENMPNKDHETKKAAGQKQRGGSRNGPTPSGPEPT